MTTATVYDALNAAIQTGPGGATSIDLGHAAATAPALGALLPVLRSFGIAGAYVLTTPVLRFSPGNAGVVLAADGVFGQPGATAPANLFAVTASLVYVEQGERFTLTLTVTGANWQFSTFFLNLPQTLMTVPGTQQLAWQPSYLTGMRLLSPVFMGTTGQDLLELSGFLPAPDNADLMARIPMIGPWPLRLSGTVRMPASAADYPLLQLVARGAASQAIRAGRQQGIQGPAPLTLGDPGLDIVVAPLRPARYNRTAFSTLELAADFSVGGITGKARTLILSAGRTWSFYLRFDKENATLVQGLSQMLGIFGLADLPLPMNFPVLKDFYVQGVDLDLDNSAAPGQMPSFSLGGFAVTIRSDKTWRPPLPFDTTFSKVGTRWVWNPVQVIDDNGHWSWSYTVNGSVFGAINFGDGTVMLPLPPPPDAPAGYGRLPVLAASNGKVTLDVALSLPNLLVRASMQDGHYIPIGKALSYFFGNDGPPTGLQRMNVTALRMSADPIGQNYTADATILFGDPHNPDPTQGWELNLLVLTVTLREASFYIAANNGRISGGIAATLFLDDGSGPAWTRPRLGLSAEYPVQHPDTPQGWTLQGALATGTSVNLTTLVYKFIYGETGSLPAWVPVLKVDRLQARLTTGTPASGMRAATNPSYSFGGTVSAAWTPQIFGTDLRVSAAVSLDLVKEASAQNAHGSLNALFRVNRFEVNGGLTFGVPEPTYRFQVKFDQVWVEAVTSWRGKDQQRHQVVSIQLGGITLGDMLEYMVNLAAPTLGFRLDPPWDVLKRIDLSRFVLTVDPKDNVVEFVFKADVNLVVMQLDTIGLRYTRGKGSGSVDMVLTGNFLGKRYTPDAPLAWDVVNDPPPAVPGQGTSLVKLRYLGLGQRVTFNVPKAQLPSTVAASVKLLRSSMKPPTDPDKLPLGAAMRYDAASQWLMGLDVALMETLDLGLIFNDPVLYGLSVGLNGERAGSLAGLRFEILYKKITPDTGMFRVELRLPDAFRTLQLGAVSLTLGIIVVEIYTNGNFKVDLGFPYNRDFTRAFSVQASVFIGRGGIYFGLLNGDTSSQVPRITNGTFSPVLELGIGIAAGVGREISAGILKGGIYVQVEVLFQGVLGWFNPNSSAAAPAKYYRARGVVAIHGRLYGAVDFAIIKVSVTLDAYAQASVSFECYRPTVFELSVGVEAEAEVEFLFFSISFSFSVNLDVSFSIGQEESTPWILADGGQPAPFQTQRSPARRLRALQQHHTRMLRQALGAHALGTAAPYTLAWQPTQPVFPDAPRQVHVTMLPMQSVADVPANWSADIPPNPSPRYRAAFVLCADSGIDPQARTAQQAVRRSAALSARCLGSDDTTGLAADVLVQALLLYALHAVPRGANQGKLITAGQMAELVREVALPKTRERGFTLGQLSDFFAANVHWLVSGDVSPRPATRGAMALPVPPFMAWTSAQAGDTDFQRKNKIGPLYEWGIAQLLGPYSPLGTAPAKRPDNDDPARYESFATYLFRDFCLMLCQAAVKEAQKAMQQSSVRVGGTEQVVWTLRATAASLPRATVSYTVSAGDTIDSVGAALGMTAGDLLELNPQLASALAGAAAGTALEVALGVTPGMLAADNAGLAFRSGQWNLGTVLYQVQAGQDLAAIATLFHVQLADVLGFASGERVALCDDPNLLRPEAAFALPQRTFGAAPADFVHDRVAAAFFVRYADPDLAGGGARPDMAAWYAQAIGSLNQDKLKHALREQTVVSDVELAPGTVLSVPNKYNDSSACNTYTSIAGDTLLRIGAALALQQDLAASDFPAGWTAFRSAVQAAEANTWTIPAATAVTVQHGETLAALVRRLVLGATWNTDATWHYDWNLNAGWIGAAAMLAPLAVVPVPNAMTADGVHSFASLNRDYGIAIADAAQCLQDQASLYPLGSVLSVSHLPAQDIDVLADAVLQGSSFAAIVNQASRMLMSGLQLPGLVKDQDGHTVADRAHPLPLYDLSGQQFDLALDPAAPDTTALALSATASAAWIVPMDSITAAAGTTEAQMQQLQQQYPQLARYNPGLGGFTYPLAASVVLLTAPCAGGVLSYSYTNASLLASSPATGLALQPSSLLHPNPQPLPQSGAVPRTYGLERRINLQSPVALPIPAGGAPVVNGQASIWPFPSTLLSRAQSADPVVQQWKYDILRAREDGAAGRHADALPNVTFGMLVGFGIRKLDGGSGRYQLVGVDNSQRHLLLSLRQQLLGHPGTSAATGAWLLLAPAPNASDASGLALFPAQPSSVFLIKSNLSTESVPQPQGLAARTDTGPVYFATMDAVSLADFLLLLWEGSVVGGTGYYFGAGAPLPASAFDAHGNATVQLLCIEASQQAAAPDGRALLPFNTCMLAGPGLDPGVHSLFAENSNSHEDTVLQATMPPGTAGFRIATDRPANVGDPAPANELLLRSLYSQLSFDVPAATGSPFAAPASGMPVQPEPWDGQRQARWARERSLRQARLRGQMQAPRSSPQPYWRYEQVLPTTRFLEPGFPEPAPAVPGLPAPGQDPYLGMGTQQTQPVAGFRFGFADVLGNRSAPSTDPHSQLAIKVGYTDPLIGTGEWPALAAHYAVEPAAAPGGAPTLAAILAARPSALLPTPSQAGDVSREPARKQAQKYSQAYYQLVQRDIKAWLVSSLQVVPDQWQRNQGVEVDAIAPLVRFAGAAYAHAGTVAAMIAAAPPAAAGTLGDLVERFGLRYTEIGEANGDVALAALFGAQAQLAVPAYRAFVEHDSAAAFYASAPHGWPLPATAGDLLALAPNAMLPLRSGVLLRRPDVASFSSGTAVPTASLAALAGAQHTTVAQLVLDNADAPVLAEGFTFHADNGNRQVASVTVDHAAGVTSFSAVRAAFAALGINLGLAELASLCAHDQGLFAPAQTLANGHFLASGAAATLGSAAAACGTSVALLASANTGTADLFDPGAAVYFGDFATQAVGADPVTLRQYAARYNCPLQRLLAHNAALAIPATTRLHLPGMLAWPDSTGALRIPYTLRQGDKLDELATRFAPTETGTAGALELVQANLAMPATLLPHVQLHLTVGGQPLVIETGTNASFQSALAQAQAAMAQATLADLVGALGGRGDVLSPGALLLCPPAKLPRDSTPGEVAALYGLDASVFALANSATPDLIVGGMTLHSPDGAASVGTVAGDTFNSLVARFSGQGVHLDAAAIATAPANAAIAFLQGGALALLPPAAARLEVPLSVSGPYPGPVFPLTACLRLTRPQELVFDDFRTPQGDGPVQRADSPLPVAATEQADGQVSSLTLDRFIARLTQAVRTLRVSTGKIDGDTSDLWCIDFGSAGIDSVTLSGGSGLSIQSTPQPRYFALAPLYNHLVTRGGVGIAPLEADGSLGAAAPMHFQEVDAELWARRFLGDLDRFLSGPCATALYSNSARQHASLKKVIGIKEQLVPLIAAGLDGVLAITDPNKVAGLADAQGALRQQLGISLSHAYNASVMVQYDARVESAWQKTAPPPPAKLYGNGRIARGDPGTADAGISIVAAKTDLSASSSYANFLVTVNDPVFHRRISGNFGYELTHTEFNISSAGTPAPYLASDWLSFVPPLAGAAKPDALLQTDPGWIEAPIPLRLFPALPVLHGQHALRSWPDVSGNLPRQAIWTYALRYAHQHAEQDYVLVTAEFNLKPAGTSLLVDGDRDLFTELAQYAMVADPLWQMLGGLTDPAASVSAATLDQTSETFQALAQRVADFWATRITAEAHQAAQDGQYVAAQAYRFNARIDYGQRSYTLKLVEGTTQPGPGGAWPQLTLVQADGTLVPLLAGTPSGNSLCYTLPQGHDFPADSWPTFDMAWTELNVAAVQNARCRMHVERNQDLLDQAPTSNRFLFRTAEVMSNGIVTPMLHSSAPQQIGGASPSAALRQALDALFPRDQRLPQLHATFAISYVYELVRNAQQPALSLTSRLPVALYPDVELADAVYGAVQNAIDVWDGRERPNPDGGRWTFSLYLYSAEEAAKRPVLVIDELYFPIAQG